MLPMATDGEERSDPGNRRWRCPVLRHRAQDRSVFQAMFARSPPGDRSIREQLSDVAGELSGAQAEPCWTSTHQSPMRLEVAQPILDHKDMAKIRSMMPTPRASPLSRAGSLRSGC